MNTTTLWAEIKNATPKGNDNNIIGQAITKIRKLQFQRKFGYAIPTPYAIDAITHFFGESSVVEVGAGLGLWARLLKDAGVDITPTDAQTYTGTIIHRLFRIKLNNCFINVRKDESYRAVRRMMHHYQGLLIICPDGNTAMCSKALAAFKGDKLVFIGSFKQVKDPVFDHLLDMNWTECGLYNIPQWPGENNQIFMFKRK